MLKGATCWLATAVSALLVIACAEQEPFVPPDRSLKIEGYVSRGIPPLDVEWRSSEIQQALAVLWELYAEDPALLPRHGSGRSGPLFEKLLAAAFSFDGLMSSMEGIPAGEFAETLERNPTAISDQSLVGPYRFRPDSGYFFDRELVEIQARGMSFTLQELRELRASEMKLRQVRARAEAAGDAELIEATRDLLSDPTNLEESFATIFLANFSELTAMLAVPKLRPATRDVLIHHATRSISNCRELELVDSCAQAEELLRIRKAGEPAA